MVTGPVGLTEDLVRAVATKQLASSDLAADVIADVVLRALSEDLLGPHAGVDVTTEATVPPGAPARGRVVAHADGVLSGLPVAAVVFRSVAAAAGRTVQVTGDVADGDAVRSGQVVLEVSGAVPDLLTAERTALNLLCQMSGTATLTRRWVEAVAGTGAVVRDTRKTVPGMRHLQKYAVRCGGGENHRLSLSDAVLVKDNHVAAAGGLASAYLAARSRYPDLPVEVECDTLAQVEEALRVGADLILLDNMSLPETRAAVGLAGPAGARTEASGGLTLASAREVAATGVDYLAVGALTHSAPALDLGFDVELLDGGVPAGGE